MLHVGERHGRVLEHRYREALVEPQRRSVAGQTHLGLLVLALYTSQVSKQSHSQPEREQIGVQSLTERRQSRC